jgi:hypothetical protein
MQKALAIEAVKLPPQNYYRACLSFAEMWLIKRKKQPFTSEDIKEAYSKAGFFIPDEGRVWGAVFNELRKQKAILHFGYTKYQNPAGHSRPINVWIKNN